MTTEWIASQLSRMAAAAKPLALNNPRYNPRPAGVIRPGSATDAVLALLCRRHPTYLNHAQIMRQTERTTKAVCFALVYLKAQGHIEATPDDSRNGRYQRYRATQKGLDHAAGRS